MNNMYGVNVLFLPTAAAYRAGEHAFKPQTNRGNAGQSRTVLEAVILRQHMNAARAGIPQQCSQHQINK